MWFGNRKQPPIRSLVGEGTVVHGDLQFRDGLRIDGEVVGNVTCEAGHSLLVLSENARVTGKVTAGHVIINGEVYGPVCAHELLELQPKARICGDVRYKMLEVHPGAVIDGEMKPLKTDERPPLKLAASNRA